MTTWPDCGNLRAMSPETTTGHDDAQRTLERKALRNVRGLVDKLETQERDAPRATLRFVVISVIAAFGLGVLAFVYIAGNKKPQAPVTSAPKAQAPASPPR